MDPGSTAPQRPQASRAAKRISMVRVGWICRLSACAGIVEGQHMLVFVDTRARQLAPQDAREDIAVIISKGRVYRHRHLRLHKGIA